MNFPNYQDPAHRERILILVGGRDSILQALNNISAIVFVPSVAPDDLYARVGRTSGDGTAAAAGAARTAYNIATSPFRFFLKNYKTAAEEIAGKDSIGVGYVEPDLTIKQAVTEALPYALRWTGQPSGKRCPGQAPL